MFKVPIISLVKVSKDTNSPSKRKTVLTIRYLYLRGIPNGPGTIGLLLEHLAAIQNLSPSLFSFTKKSGLCRIVDQVKKKMVGSEILVGQVRLFIDFRKRTQGCAIDN